MPGKAQSDAPNYREATGDQRCGTCMHFMDGRCGLYNFAADPAYVCDSWAARGMMGGLPPMEYKSLPQFTKEITDRTVVGIGAVHGNLDEGGDRSWPGAFAAPMVNGRMRTRFLWQHDGQAPPTAKINYIREVPRADLPKAVLAYAPDALGGVEVSRTYLETPRGNEVLTGLQAGAIDEMSYAYDAKQFDFEEVDGRMVRNLRKVEVYDFSDVNWGMNPATVGVKGLPLEIEQQTAHAAVARYITRLEALAQLRAKEGRVLSGENRKRIESTIEALDSAIEALKALLAASEPQKRGGYSDTNALRAAWSRQQQRLRELGVST